MSRPGEIKRLALWSIIAVISFVLRFLIPYLEGRFNDSWGFILPASSGPFILQFVSCIVFLSIWIRLLLAKRPTVIAALVFFVSVFLFGVSFTAHPAALFQRGFYQYAKNVLTADEWRSIAHFAREHAPPNGQIPGPRKNLWREADHRALWSALTVATQVRKLDPSLVIYVHPAITEFVWGGALAGHRGITILTNTNGGNHYDDSIPSTHIAGDISIFVSPN